MDVEFGRRGFHLAVTAEESFERAEERPIRSVAVEGIQRVCEKFQLTAISDAQEHPENIEVIELPLARLAAMGDSGALQDMKTLLLLQTLRLRRPQLFG